MRILLKTTVQAVEFVMRTNKRRNLNSSQWACIATEADELILAIREKVEKERRERQAEARKITEETKKVEPEQSGEGEKVVPQLIGEQPKNTHGNESLHKIATTFNTNRTYIGEAQRLKRDNPVMFEKVKAG